MIASGVASRHIVVPGVVTLITLLLTSVAGVVVGLEALSARSMIMVLFGVLAVPVALICLGRPGFGVGLLPLVAAVVPVEIGTGTQSPIVAALIFAGLLVGLWLLRGLLSRELTIVRSPATIPTLALLVVWIAAYLSSQIGHSPLVWNWDSFFRAQLGQLAVVLISGLVLLLAASCGADLRWVQTATWSLIAVGVVSVLAFYANHLDAIRFVSTGGLFTMWGASLAYGQALFNRQLPGWLRVGLILLVVAWLFKAMILQTIWFSGWVPTLVAVVVITFFKTKPGFLAFLIGGAAFVALNRQQVVDALWTAKVEEGDLTRVGIWDQAWQLISQHPILGTGPAGYAAYYMSLYKGSEFSLSTHSGYMDILSETGYVGALVFGCFMLSLFAVAWKARAKWHGNFAAGYAHSMSGGLVGLAIAMLLGDWFIPFVYNQTIVGFRYTVYSWLFFGFLVGMVARQPDGEKGENGPVDYRR